MKSYQILKNEAEQKAKNKKKENARDIISKSILVLCGFEKGGGLRVLIRFGGQRNARTLGAKKKRRKWICQGPRIRFPCRCCRNGKRIQLKKIGETSQNGHPKKTATLKKKDNEKYGQ